jgi:hypothetical protein
MVQLKALYSMNSNTQYKKNTCHYHLCDIRRSNFVLLHFITSDFLTTKDENLRSISSQASQILTLQSWRKNAYHKWFI